MMQQLLGETENSQELTVTMFFPRFFALVARKYFEEVEEVTAHNNTDSNSNDNSNSNASCSVSSSALTVPNSTSLPALSPSPSPTPTLPVKRTLKMQELALNDNDSNSDGDHYHTTVTINTQITSRSRSTGSIESTTTPRASKQIKLTGTSSDPSLASSAATNVPSTPSPARPVPQPFLPPPVPPPPGFPRYSSLSAEEHKLYLELQQKMMKDQQARSTPVPPSAPPALVMIPSDIAQFNRLRPYVMKEQEEYHGFLLHEATTSPANKQKYLYIHPLVDKQLQDIFCRQRNRVLEQYPRYYDVHAAFDIRAIAVAPSDPVLKHLRTLLQVVCAVCCFSSFFASLY